MTDKQVAEMATEAVKIYFDYNVSVKEAIEKVKEEYQSDLSRRTDRKS